MHATPGHGVVTCQRRVKFAGHAQIPRAKRQRPEALGVTAVNLISAFTTAYSLPLFALVNSRFKSVILASMAHDPGAAGNGACILIFGTSQLLLSDHDW
jgi:hypothetical protein